MSVKKNSEDIIVIECQKYTSFDDHRLRIISIISLIQQRDTNIVDNDAVYHALSLLEDMLPDDDQWQKILPNQPVLK